MLRTRQATSINEFDSVVSEGYYQADSYVAGYKPIRSLFELQMTNAGIIPICRFRGTSIGVRRNWNHIRGAMSGLYVIWFPCEGTISVTQDHVHDAVSRPGSMIITCGDRPFHIRSLSADSNAYASQLHILVPSHVMYSLVPEIDRYCGRVFSAEHGSASVAREIFSHLVQDTRFTNEGSAEKLGHAALEAVADSVKDETRNATIHIQDASRQSQRILSYIEGHFTSPGLTADRVAKACAISRRQLHYILKNCNVTFAKVLWECRLKKAHEWLNDPSFHHFNIADIAYMAGFRSSSHFSHAFKSRFGYPPLKLRTP